VQDVINRINGLISSRNAARSAKNFKESDRIRDELAAMGVALKDSKEGTTWEVPADFRLTTLEEQSVLYRLKLKLGSLLVSIEHRVVTFVSLFTRAE
jgi:hypothetical protein